MKVLNIGSLNVDRVYHVDRFVRAKETVMAQSCELFCGGKGLNQSLALARAGVGVMHAGAYGFDGDQMMEMLKENGVDIRFLRKLDMPSGQAIIQIDNEGQNCIIVYGGANTRIDTGHINDALSRMEENDMVLIQNETNNIPYIMDMAKKASLRIAFNPSPVSEELLEYPIDLVDYLVLNEVEGKFLSVTSSDRYGDILDGLVRKYPETNIVLTVGSDGAYFRNKEKELYHGVYDVEVVDTTAAGDAFCGYFLASVLKNFGPEKALEYASAAGSLTVGKKGAGPSIPGLAMVEQMFRRKDMEGIE